MAGVMDVSLLGAFIAGLLSFISPCVLPLLPTFALILAGSEQIGGLKKWQAATMFLLGFSLIFVLLGATASTLGQLLWDYQDRLRQIGAIITILLGAFLAGLIPVSFLQREYRHLHHVETMTLGGAFLLGMSFSLGWTPCTGPILAAILLYAGQSATLAQGVFLLIAYVLGFAVPFFLLTVVWHRYLPKLRRFYGLLPRLQKATGILMILLGLLLWSNGLKLLIRYLTL